LNDTTPEEIAQTLDEDESTVMTTASLLVAVAVGVYDNPFCVALVGAVEVTVITLFCVDTSKLVDVAVALPSTAVKV
jgi:hypothetical protein